jgi:uncharacterized membrane protein YuzA (DUF378 family)
MTGQNCAICKVFCLLVIVGALNWGLVGAFNINLVEQLLGVGTTATKIVYILVGISGLGVIAGCLKMCPACKK